MKNVKICLREDVDLCRILTETEYSNMEASIGKNKPTFQIVTKESTLIIPINSVLYMSVTEQT